MTDSLSAGEARRMTLRAQGLLGRGGEDRPRTPAAVIHRVTALQLDTISVLARSHELVCYARCGPAGRAAVEQACWGSDGNGDPVGVEYWAHAACVLPVETWPWWAFRRRRNRLKDDWWQEVRPEAVEEVRKRLTAGPLTASQLGGAKGGGQWWDWSPVKVAVERLLAIGEVVCTTRVGWKRVYALTETALPPHLLGEEPDDAACLSALVGKAGRCMGVATSDDLADYFRLHREDVAAALPDTDLVPVEVEGWGAPAWADPAALASVGRRGRHRTTLLSPFDSLIWHRARTRRIWGFDHRLEAYTPAARRVHGYYAMPVLAGGELVGRVDPARSGSTLVARRVQVGSAGAVPAVAEALIEAAAWVGAGSVAVEAVDPPELRAALVSLTR